MKKIVLMGRSEAGKTTLTQALKGEKIQYHKTQYVNNFDVIIDTPGEYAQTKNLGHALALYTYEADVVGADGAGWHTVWFNHRNRERLENCADVTVRSIEELSRFIKERS